MTEFVWNMVQPFGGGQVKKFCVLAEIYNEGEYQAKLSTQFKNEEKVSHSKIKCHKYYSRECINIYITSTVSRLPSVYSVNPLKSSDAYMRQ